MLQGAVQDVEDPLAAATTAVAAVFQAKRDGSDGEDGDDEIDDTGQSADVASAADVPSSSSVVIASMRSAAGEKEIMATDFLREVPSTKPRFYIGDIENYSIIDKVGSGTYGCVGEGRFCFLCGARRVEKLTADVVAVRYSSASIK